MASQDFIRVSDLRLDLRNYRTLPQENEADAFHALVTIDTDAFWALTESLLEDEYQPNELIVVLNSENQNLVKEGNRRVAAMKLILGQIRLPRDEVPSHIASALEKLPAAWKKRNSKLPCTIYDASESKVVDRLVSRIHGKQEKARRIDWTAIARARHNREQNGASEPALDLFDAFLGSCRTIDRATAEQWSGTYPITVLAEFVKANAIRFGVKSAKELADRYPEVTGRMAIEQVIQDIGRGIVTFKDLRISPDEVERRLKLPSLPEVEAKPSVQGASERVVNPDTGRQAPPRSGRKLEAVPSTDPRSVRRLLGRLKIKGDNRTKIRDLVNEAKTLDLRYHPFAFCFLLRSILEISAVTYCQDHRRRTGAPRTHTADNKEKPLVDLLGDVLRYISDTAADKDTKRDLGPAIGTLKKPTNFLSVSSLNRLIHGGRAVIGPDEICREFHNVFPALERMNA